MIYRKLGKDKIKVSQLGFGCMRLPIVNNDTKNINIEETRELLKYAINNGVNYIDTAYPYHGGKSEEIVGKILNEEKLREKVYLTSKLSLWMIDDKNKQEEFLNNQLTRTKQNYFDFYLVHALNKKSWNTAKQYDTLKFLDEAKKKGKIKYTGFSFHDESLELFKEIVDSYNWDLVQIQYNYLDTNYQAGKQGLEYCESKGIDCVIMEPLKGGQLAKELPIEAQTIFKQNDSNNSFASWALRWLFNQKNVKVVLSGMGELYEVVDNIKSASKYNEKGLTNIEKTLIKQTVAIINNKKRIPCTSCQYCMPCPQGVLIPNNFEYYNKYYDINSEKNKKDLINMYNETFIIEEKAKSCIKCGLCEKHCPQNLKIRDLLDEVKSIFK